MVSAIETSKKSARWICAHHHQLLRTKYGDLEVITIPPMGWKCEIDGCDQPEPYRKVSFPIDAVIEKSK